LACSSCPKKIVAVAGFFFFFSTSSSSLFAYMLQLFTPKMRGKNIFQEQWETRIAAYSLSVTSLR